VKRRTKQEKRETRRHAAIARSDRGARVHQLGPPRDAQVRGKQWHQVDHAPQGQLYGGGCVCSTTTSVRPPQKLRALVPPSPRPLWPPGASSIGAMARATDRIQAPAAQRRIERGARLDDRSAIGPAAPLAPPLSFAHHHPKTCLLRRSTKYNPTVQVQEDESEDVAVRRFMKSVVQSGVINQVRPSLSRRRRRRRSPTPLADAARRRRSPTPLACLSRLDRSHALPSDPPNPTTETQNDSSAPAATRSPPSRCTSAGSPTAP